MFSNCLTLWQSGWVSVTWQASQLTLRYKGICVSMFIFGNKDTYSIQPIGTKVKLTLSQWHNSATTGTRQVTLTVNESLLFNYNVITLQGDFRFSSNGTKQQKSILLIIKKRCNKLFNLTSGHLFVIHFINSGTEIRSSSTSRKIAAIFSNCTRPRLDDAQLITTQPEINI